jgi:5-methylcytosine-specific restriction endonuclease McrA
MSANQDAAWLKSAYLKRLIDGELQGRSERELAERDWRAYRRVRELRVDFAKALVYERHATDEYTVQLAHTFNNPIARAAVTDFNARIDLDAFSEELRKAVADADADYLTICGGCNRVIPCSDRVQVQVETGYHSCLPCAEQIWNQPSYPPACGIRSACSRARKHGLPVTLTEPDWARAVEHFKDRCAYCALGWCLIEHATPVERGGGTSLGNCLPACTSCNARKGSMTIEEYLADASRRVNRERVTYALNWLWSNGREKS